LSELTFETKPPAVYAAIAAVTAKLAKEGIAKNKKNDQQGYKFRGIDDVYNALSAHIAEAGLCILPRVTSREVTERTTRNGGVLFYTVLDVEFDFVAASDGSKHTVRVPGEAMDSGDKSTNKAMSAAYKYACMQAFCIPTEGDNDPDKTTHDVAPSKGIGYHDPKGDVGLDVPLVEATDAAARVRNVLAANNPTEARSLNVELNKNQDLYMAAWRLLHSKERSTFKKLLDAADEVTQ